MSAFSVMQKQGFNHDRIVLPSVLKACGHLSDRKTGEKLHAVVLKNGFGSDPFVSCSLIDMYSKCFAVENAKLVFDEMPERDLVSLNTMVSGFVHNSSVKEAMGLVEKMKSSGFRPDIVTWNSLISGLIQNSQSPKAYSVFRKMLRVRLSPTSSTISSLLPGPANTANLRRGKEIHGYSIIIGLNDDIYVKSALIDMYAKCGSISEAMTIFRKMPERNTVTWNSMIFGYANHGYCNEAIGLFYKMLEKDDKKLDHLSFTAALTACAHAGTVDLGKGLFRMMWEKYRIEPRVEHFACMVDLLGRAGKVEEAYGVICKMPVEPDLFVWGALLGACKRHGCMDLAEVAAGKLAKLEPRSSGSSVALLSLYADSSRWGNVLEMKRTMKKRKLRSYPSRSWIEVL
ncbi:pentatricopeptide repeat-containing protein at5g59600 [Phtheirospermum japonicum]|uniref:Pentatricopeptide repeat-containing protein at5g59600 n=1 Tax=Phtheirospermum japonicum TaxID=374723 RepID=A0A830BQ33_9LAMI|nr:pentatricopeptide repeat-containing protein at5g59600 [Phtheirospermum japonicum]